MSNQHLSSIGLMLRMVFCAEQLEFLLSDLFMVFNQTAPI